MLGAEEEKVDRSDRLWMFLEDGSKYRRHQPSLCWVEAVAVVGRHGRL
jgi:hypothetical protein